MSQLILLRHGQSIWNARNLFTGWVDVPLSEKGINEALEAGEQIKDIPIDIIYMSSLIRSKMTAMLAMSKHKGGKTPVMVNTDQVLMEDWSKIYNEEEASQSIPAYSQWEFNERMYGDLQGLNKDQMVETHGKEQVEYWRRSFNGTPPNGESLKKTADRVVPYFKKFVYTRLSREKNILISAHGNSLRALIMELNQLSEESIVNLEIPTGKPIVYHYNNKDGSCLMDKQFSIELP